MLASLAGGSSCGPSNPLQQLSKTHGRDRGAAQDHFGAAGPSGQGSSFRQPSSAPQAQALPADPSAQAFFHPSHPSHQASAFDLSPLNRALTPSHAAPPATPVWATAFQAQQPQTGSSSQAEQELFARAFGGGAAAGPAAQSHAWSGEFQQHRASPSAAPQLQHQQHGHQPHEQALYQPSVQQARLYGQGFAPPGVAVGGMMRFGGPQAGMGREVEVERQRREEDARAQTKGGQDWERAFLQQEASSLPTSTLADPSSSSYLTSLTETRPLTPPLRAHSPVASDTAARDALAQTAANLLHTVRSAEAQRLAGGVQPQGADQAQDVGSKFKQSGFMSLMRQLRDGEVAVEGDRVVEQHSAVDSGKGKGKARADGWASDFAATLSPSSLERQEEGRSNSAYDAPPVFSPGQGVEAFARAQHAWADRHAREASIVRELQEGYRTMEGLWDDEDRVRAAREGEASAKDKGKGKMQFQGDGGLVDDEEVEEAATHVPLAQSGWEEDLDDPSFIAGGHAPGLVAHPPGWTGQLGAQQREWDALQSAWDEMDVTATGLTPAAGVEASTSSTAHGYAFAQNNPYLQLRREQAAAASTRQHARHAHAAGAADLSHALLERHDSLLQREADVQHDPSSAGAWLALGLKQQQNEREDLAISALQRAISLDGTVGNGAAHLALAISFTNEGKRFDAYEQINQWVDALARSSEGAAPAYANEIDQYRNLFGASLPRTVQERHAYLSNLLIRLAQSHAERAAGGAHAVDADVQVALGVLFNTSDEFEKAGDCFEAALSVRPDDPLLFNRLGATYANSGKTDVAMQYYLAALDLDPGFVRARFNLAVANMNLAQYEDAVHHLLTSLSIQEADAEQDHLEQAPTSERVGGVTSNTLWDSLSISLLQMHRSDLSSLAAARDLKGLLRAFPSLA
ncbi:hypothetical protein JCM10207_008259 [Rhodosporidiobolus poonsookiae]